MENFTLTCLILHIMAGGAALLFGFGAIVTKKGSQLHRQWGRVYFWSMLLVFLSAVVLSILSPNPFLLMVGFFSFYLVVSAYRILYLKKLHQGQKASPIDWAIVGTASIFQLGLLIWGIYQVFFQENNLGVVAIVFAVIGFISIYQQVRHYIHPPKEGMYWMYTHIRGMMGGYIATFTAFLVVNVDFLPPIVPWLLPTVLGSPMIFYWVRFYKLKAKARSQPLNP